MSTKTLRKRIALVAVSALTAGVLSVASAPVANAAVANGITKADIYLAAAGGAGSAAAIGQCAIASSALLADAQSVGTTNSTGTVLAVGAVVTFITATNGTGNLTVTGPAKLIATGTVASQTISQDAKGVGFVEISSTLANLEVTGAGDIVVTAKDSATIGSGSAQKTFSITGVDSCASGATPVAANTIMEIATTGGSPSTGGATGDATLAYADKDYEEVIHIRIALRNQYKANLTTAGVLTAESSNPNALLQFDAANGNVGPTAFLAGTVVGQSGGHDLEVSQNTVLAPGAALSTTITFKWNGVVVGTKAVSILGRAASIVVDQADVTIGNSDSGDNSGTFKYLVKDNAGNNLGNGATGTLVAATGITGAAAGFVSAGIVSDVKSATGADGSTKGTGTYDCLAFAAGVSSGSQKATVGFLSGTTLIKSNEFTATCGGAAIGSFTFAMDKAVYSPGEIATVTFTAKDLNGGVTSDAAVIGAAFNQISIPGMTIIGSAISSADVFTSGTKSYKFRVDQAEGSFVGQGQVTVSSAAASAEKTVKTALFSIKASGTSVTNAEVLKSIVALIASINKQIQALQKLILKR